MQNNTIKPILMIKGMLGVNILFFAASLILTGKNIHLSINPFTALSPSTNVLIYLGASGTIPIEQYHQWWSLITANWLHGSLLHIIFNMIALWHIGHIISALYGMHRMFIIYTLSGMAGFYLSWLAGISVTIGASASICGLLGASFYFGKSQGGVAGSVVSKMTSGWIFSLVIFGIAVPNINNWGHGGGFATGIFLGWILGYNERKKESSFHALISYLLMVSTIAIVGWEIFSAFQIR
ncbi:MAG: rhomboid family intramembrane serine protease [Desulfamplus sp.]|nr:rhomboid family intramembrane serine protease [Desulfamplus sp.]